MLQNVSEIISNVAKPGWDVKINGIRFHPINISNSLPNCLVSLREVAHNLGLSTRKLETPTQIKVLTNKACGL